MNWIQSSEAAVDPCNAFLKQSVLHPTGTGPCDGRTVCVKDVIDVEGLLTRAGSARWQRTPSVDATAVARLRSAGATVVGKGATNEFALGIDGLNPHYGDTRNPHDPARMSGGSSSGPAVAVALGACALGLGTDTTGSLRIPAAFCGVVGIRPAHGAVPVDGVVPLAPVYDTVGPLAATVAEAALALGVLSGDAELTAWATDGPAPAERLDGTRVGVVSAWHDGRCDDAVAGAFAAVLAALRHRGAEIVQVDLPELEDIEQTHMIVQLSAAFASHAPWFAEQREHYSAVVLGLLERGAGYGPELVAERDCHRARVAIAIDAALDGVEAIAMPAAPCAAPLRDALTIALGGAPRELRAALLALAIPFSQATGPTVALPMGRHDGLPLGLQLHGRAGREQQLLALALAAEAIG